MTSTCKYNYMNTLHKITTSNTQQAFAEIVLLYRTIICHNKR